jgi:hypothetical protein
MRMTEEPSPSGLGASWEFGRAESTTSPTTPTSPASENSCSACMTGLRPIPLRRQCFPSAPRGPCRSSCPIVPSSSRFVSARRNFRPRRCPTDSATLQRLWPSFPWTQWPPSGEPTSGARVEAATAADEFMWIRRDVHSTARVGWLGRVVRRQERTVAPVPIGNPVIHEATSLASSRAFSTTHSTN